MAETIGLRAKLDLSQFNRDVKAYIQATKDMTGATQKLSSNTSKGLQNATGSITKFGVSWQRVKDIVSAVFIIDVFRRIKNSITSVTSEAISAVEAFQKLNIQFEALAARDYAKQHGIPTAKAFNFIGKQAKELLQWVRKIAVTTPFSVETLSRAVAYGQAFGFNIPQAKRLTLAVGNFTSGMGLTNEQLERIIYNFGQMLASGRILGRELRDLANNFVPVNDVIQLMADEAEVSFAQMREDMKKGIIPATAFIQKFVEIAENDFPDAMQRMSRTLSGVKQNIQDFIQTLFGLELLGPVMDDLAKRMADFLDAAFSPKVLRFFTAIGLAINNAFQGVSTVMSGFVLPAIRNFITALGIAAPSALDFATAILKIGLAFEAFFYHASRAINFIADLVSKIREAISNYLGDDLGDKMRDWGAGAIAAFAQGMADAITYIVNVLISIANIISGWLRAKSPPKLLPKLDWWGRQAMQSWIDGWASADFNVFNKLASTVAGYIRALSAKIPETDIIPRILGARTAIAQLIAQVKETGEVTEDAINKIFKAMKLSSPSIKAYITALIKFAAVSKKMEEVKKILDFDLESGIPTDIFGVTVDSLEDLLRVADKLGGALGSAVRSYVSALGALNQANRELVDTQKQINDETEKYDDILRALNNQLEDVTEFEDEEARIRKINAAIATGLLTKEERRRLELEKQEIQLRRNIRETQRERDSVLDALKDKEAAQKEAAAEAEKAADRQREIALQLAEAQADAAKEQLDAAKSLVDIQIENNQLMSQQIELLKRLAAAAAKAAAGAGLTDKPGGIDFEGLMGGIEDDLLAVSEELQAAIDQLQKDLRKRIFTFIFETFTKPFRESKIGEAFAEFGVSLGELKIIIQEKIAEIKESAAFQTVIDAVNNFVLNMTTAWTNLKTFWEQNGEEILGIIGSFFTRLQEKLGIDEGFDQKVADTFAGVLDTIGEGIVNLTTILIENGPQIQESLQNAVDWIFDVGLPKLKEFADWVRGDAGQDIIEFGKKVLIFAGLVVAGIVAVKGVLAGFGLLTLIGQIAGGIGIFITSLTAAGTIGATLATAAATLAPILAVIAGVIATVIGVVVLAIGIFTAFKKNLFGFRTAATGIFNTIKKTLGPTFEDLQEAVAELRKALAPLLKVLAPIGKFIKGVLIVVFKILGVVLGSLAVTIIAVITGIVNGLVRAVEFITRVSTLIVRGFQRVNDGIKHVIDAIKLIFLSLFGTGTREDLINGLTLLGMGILEILYGLLESIAGIFGSGLAAVTGLVVGFVEGIIKFFINLYNEVVGKSIIPDMMKDMYDVFKIGFLDIIRGIGKWVQEMLDKIAGFVKPFIDTGKELIENLKAGIKEIFTNPTGVIESVFGWIGDTIAKIVDRAHEFLNAGLELIQNLLDGIAEKFEGTLLGNLAGFMSDAVAVVRENIADWVTAGKDLLAGVIDGIAQKAIDLYNKIRGVVKKALGIARGEAKAESPAKKWMVLGSDMMEGVELGITGRLGKTKKVIRDAIASIQKPLEGAASMISGNSRMIVANSPVTRQMSPYGAMSSNVDRSINVEVNPTYKNIATEATIRHDVSAALNFATR